MTIVSEDREYIEFEYLQDEVKQATFQVTSVQLVGMVIKFISKVIDGEHAGKSVSDRFDLNKETAKRAFKWFMTRFPEFYTEQDGRKFLNERIEEQDAVGKIFKADGIKSEGKDGKVFINLTNYKSLTESKTDAARKATADINDLFNEASSEDLKGIKY